MSRSKKITELDTLASAAQGDLFIIERVEANTSTTSAITVEDLFSNISTDVVVGANNFLAATTLSVSKNNTPTVSTGTFRPRQFWFDNDYMYVAVNGTTLKRISLQAF